LHRRLRKRIGLFSHLLGIVALDRGLGFSERRLDLGLHRRIDLVAMLLELLLGRVDEAFGLVLGLGRRTPLLVVLGELLGFLHHLVDVGIRKTTGGLDADLLLLAGSLVLGGHVHDAVGI